MIPEASIEATEHGQVPRGEGWFVVNARDARWYAREGRGAICPFEGERSFPQVGVNLFWLGPGEPMSMYHWEADQEGFLVLDGEGLLIVEGVERPLRQWDFVHCPADTRHTIVGGPCLVLAIGARDRSVDNPDWGGYPVEEAALRHDAGVEQETTLPREAYAGFPANEPSRCRDEWLSG